MKGRSLPIRYRDFYDIPRAVVVEYERTLYFLDCPFHPDLDDYDEYYTIYLIPDDLREAVDSMSWTDLGHRSQRIGTIRTSLIEFDDTKRQAISARIFKGLQPHR